MPYIHHVKYNFQTAKVSDQFWGIGIRISEEAAIDFMKTCNTQDEFRVRFTFLSMMYWVVFSTLIKGKGRRIFFVKFSIADRSSLQSGEGRGGISESRNVLRLR